MKRQTVCSVWLIFLFASAVLVLGLSLCEKGLLEVNGWSQPPAACLLSRSEQGDLILTLAGRQYRILLTEATVWIRPILSRFFH